MNRDDASPEKPSSTIPAFLDQDPFPTHHDGRPRSTTSDGMSEPDTPTTTTLTTLGPVGESGLPPSRPLSNLPSNENTRMASVRTSAGPPPSSSRTFRPFSKSSALGDDARPPSGSMQTHVPALTVPVFHPMSPQQLQAQRGQHITRPRSDLPGHQTHPNVQEEEGTDTEARRRNSYANSIASVKTMKDRDIGGRDSNVPSLPPLPGGRAFSVTSSTDAHYAAPDSVVSKSSVTPLTKRQPPGIYATMDPLPRSPISFRNSIGWGSRQSSRRDVNEGRPSNRDREKLPSHPASPTDLENEKRRTLSQRSMPKTKGKNYEYYAGNMLFFLAGRCMNTKAKPLNLVTFTLTVLPAVLFFIFEAPWLWHNVSPALPIIFGYIFYVALSAFLHAAFSDPGTIPRNLHPHPSNPEEDHDPLTVGPPTTEWVMVKTFPSSKQKIPNLEGQAETGSIGAPTTAMEVPTKYCKSCNIWRPPRAHHCRICDACIETQDHHCVWLNNCVGRRNYRYFFAYVGFGSVMAFLLIAFSLIHVAVYAHQNDITFGESLSGRTEERVAFAMFIYAVLALPYPGSLFGYHLFLVARGETTREYLNSHKFLPKDRHRPFSQSSLWKNWAAVLGRPRPPSYMAFKKPYIEGDVRYGHTLRSKERKQQGQLEAARSKTRVEGLKKRFSVAKSSRQATADSNAGKANQADPRLSRFANGGVDSGMEMSQLPPPPTTGDSSKAEGSSIRTMKKNRPGGSDATPR